MRDSTIFKLAAGAGILAFVARLVLVQPEDLGMRRGVATQHRGDEIGRLALEGEYEAALAIAVRRQSESYLDQGGWARIASLLEGQAQHEGRPFDATVAIESFRTLAPKGWVEHTGAVGWVAYFIGIAIDDDGQAQAAWRIGAECFDRLIQERPERATPWDWLYRARTWMRLEDAERTRQALVDGSHWVETALRASSGAQAVEEPISFVRTYGRTWAYIGAMEEAQSLWRRSEDLMAAEWSQSRIAESWQAYARDMYRAGERNAGDLATDMCLAMLERITPEDADSPIRVSSMWQDMARRFSRRDDFEQAAAALDRAIVYQRLAVAQENGAQDWYDLARMLARRGDAEDALAALTRAVEAGYMNADRLAGEDDFEPLRSDPRYQDLVATTYQLLEALYPSAEEETDQRNLRRNGR